ncbi:response regulator [Kiritimatiellaeota bacterium B1221]|nr:response regulator [Kiritimatiellaeota bacterium B1221]
MPTPHMRLLSRFITDLETRSKNYETDEDVLDDELRELFDQELDRTLKKLLLAAPKKDESAMRDCAHTLLGIGGVAGAPEISVLGEELSEAAKTQRWERCAELVNALSEWKNARTFSPSGEIIIPVQSPQLSGRILVVDDEEPNRAYLKKILEECGAEVFIAENGEQALELVPELRPDLALVDVVMPGIQGYEVCEQIIHSPEMGQTSVIMVTAKSTPADVETAFRKGAFDYIRKPFNSRELLARVRNALTLKNQTDALTLWKSKMSRELETAGKVQSKLFDSTPDFSENFDCKICYRPSQHIGGDMFDMLHLADGRCLTYLADVAGHGVGSALISTLIKGLAQEIVSGTEIPELHEIGNELHHRFRKCVEDPELYATMLLILWKPGETAMSCLSCGHPPPLAFSSENQYLPGHIPATGGMPIGLMPPEFGKPFLAEDVIHFEMPASGALYLYTDGISEAKNPAGEECGVEHLLRAIHLSMNSSPDMTLDLLQEQGFQLNADDCTLMQIHLISEPKRLACGEINMCNEEVQRLSSEVYDLLTSHGWEEEDAGMVQLLLIEHGANVVNHGNPPPNSTLFYRLHLEDHHCYLVLKDRGIFWDPSHWQPQDPDTRDPFAEHGRGLDLIAEISATREYFRREHQNCFLYRIDKDLRRRLNI